MLAFTRMSTHDVFSWKVIKPYTKTQIIPLKNSLIFSAIFLPVTCKKNGPNLSEVHRATAPDDRQHDKGEDLREAIN